MKLMNKLGVILTFAATLAVATNAHALPAYARQTQMTCNACHNGNFLALNAFGRQFKLSGYTLTNSKTIEKKTTGESKSRLSLPGIPGLSAMLQTSVTHTNSGIAGQQNNDIRLPQQLSLFLAGRVTDKIGIFSQFTYANGDSGFAIDNTEIRYADTTTINDKPLNYGFTLDNNPTVGDLWNSTPAWGFPYSSSDVANGPAAGEFIGSLGGAVSGLGAYSMLNYRYYGKLSFYRSTQNNGTTDNTNVIDGLAPYWRFAWQTTLGGGGNLMLGTYGMYAKVLPQALQTNNGIGGPLSKYMDSAIDFQYERPLSGESALIMHGSYTNEKRTDLASDGSYLAGNNTNWKFSKLDAQYNLAGRWRPGISYFNANTGDDNLDTNGFTLDASYFPWENVQLQLQYTGYSKFDGDTANVSDNNSIYLLLWLVM